VPANTASWALMERLGMRKLGTFDHPMLPEGDPLRAHVVYEIR
jgi:RimJ/RimL family protein N-acetyltransferase